MSEKFIASKGKVIVDCADITEEFEGCVRFSMILEPDEAEFYRSLHKVNGMVKATGFERPPAGYLFWSRELVLLSGEIGPERPFNVREILGAIIDKLVAQWAERAEQHAKEEG